jgi:hypothetical protein
MAVPKKRTTRGAQGQRRSHDALKGAHLQPASNGALVPRRLFKAVSLGLIKTKDR